MKAHQLMGFLFYVFATMALKRFKLFQVSGCHKTAKN